MYTIEYLPIARRDMVDIAKYIGVKLANPDAAERLAEKMLNLPKIWQICRISVRCIFRSSL